MADIKEKSTGWDSFEMRQQKAANDRLRQQLAAKRAAKLGLTQSEPEKKKVNTRIRQNDDVVLEDTIGSIIEDLRERFLVSGKEMPNNSSVKAMQQFMRFTDPEYAKKNTAGGSFFTEYNRFKKEARYGNIVKNVERIRIPVMEINHYLRNVKSFDNQHLEVLRYKILDLCEAMPNAVDEIRHDPVAIQEIKAKVKFWVGDGATGHNVGFEAILRQFKKDMMDATYQQIAQRIEDFITKGRDPMSYVAEGKKLTIKESVLRKLIRESIQMHLNEGTMDNDAIEKWQQVEDQIGPKQMLDCIFQWTDADTIDQWLQWFEQEEWVDFGGSSYIDDEEEDDENNFGV